MSASTSAISSSAPLCERGYFPSQDGLRLYREIHAVPEGTPRAGVLLVHGYAEHCGRYHHVARFLVDRGYSVMAFDYRGHGQAAGVRGHTDRFDQFLGDLDAAVAALKERPDLLGPDGRFFLVAHSHGGLVSMRYLLDRPVPAGLAGIAFSAPFFGLKLQVPAYKRLLAQAMSGMNPSLAIPTEVDARLLCHDERVRAAYESDPLVNKHATARWFTEALEAQERVLAGCRQLSVPSLFLQGTDDVVVDPEASRRAFERVTHVDKQFRSYPGLYHELFNEPSGPQVLEDLESWLREHL